MTLPEKKFDRSNATAGARLPRFGIAYNDRVYVAFDEQVYRYDEGVGWTLLHNFAGGAVPTGRPVEWGGRRYWPLGTSLTHFNGTIWSNVAIPAQVILPVGTALYVAAPSGAVSVTAVSPPVGTGSMTLVANLNALPTSAFPYPDAAGVVVPHIVTDRFIYAIDLDALEANIAGPMLPPIGPFWTPSCAGGGLVPTAADLSLVELWDY